MSNFSRQTLKPLSVKIALGFKTDARQATRGLSVSTGDWLTPWTKLAEDKPGK
jgi:hypothetical protein